MQQHTEPEQAEQVEALRDEVATQRGIAAMLLETAEEFRVSGEPSQARSAEGEAYACWRHAEKLEQVLRDESGPEHRQVIVDALRYEKDATCLEAVGWRHEARRLRRCAHAMRALKGKVRPASGGEVERLQQFARLSTSPVLRGEARRRQQPHACWSPTIRYEQRLHQPVLTPTRCDARPRQSRAARRARRARTGASRGDPDDADADADKDPVAVGDTGGAA